MQNGCCFIESTHKMGRCPSSLRQWFSVQARTATKIPEGSSGRPEGEMLPKHHLEPSRCLGHSCILHFVSHRHGPNSYSNFLSIASMAYTTFTWNPGYLGSCCCSSSSSLICPRKGISDRLSLHFRGSQNQLAENSVLQKE